MGEHRFIPTHQTLGDMIARMEADDLDSAGAWVVEIMDPEGSGTTLIGPYADPIEANHAASFYLADLNDRRSPGESPFATRVRALMVPDPESRLLSG